MRIIRCLAGLCLLIFIALGASSCQTPAEELAADGLFVEEPAVAEPAPEIPNTQEVVVEEVAAGEPAAEEVPAAEGAVRQQSPSNLLPDQRMGWLGDYTGRGDIHFGTLRITGEVVENAAVQLTIRPGSSLSYNCEIDRSSRSSCLLEIPDDYASMRTFRLREDVISFNSPTEEYPFLIQIIRRPGPIDGEPFFEGRLILFEHHGDEVDVDHRIELDYLSQD